MNLLASLFITFFKIGAFTFGGGYAMLPMVQQEVAAHGWMSTQELINFIAVSESTPGPFAVNVSTYVGAHTAGLPGALCATLGVILPSFIIILLIAKAYKKFEENRYVKGAMGGLRPAVVGLIGAAVLSVGKTVFLGDTADAANAATAAGASVASLLLSPAFYISAAIFLLAIFLRSKKKVHPIKIIVLSALIGIAVGYAGLL